MTSYVGPALYEGSRTNQPINRIVIHSSRTRCMPGEALRIASIFTRDIEQPLSAHYVVDPRESVQVVLDHMVAFHAPPNIHTLAVVLCEPATANASDWLLAPYQDLLDQAAHLIARLCRRHEVPVQRVTRSLANYGVRGICAATDVSDAFTRSTMQSPDDSFPWDELLRRVQAYYDDSTQTAPAPEPEPAAKIDPPKEKKKARVTSTNDNNDMPTPTAKQLTADLDVVYKRWDVSRSDMAVRLMKDLLRNNKNPDREKRLRDAVAAIEAVD